MICISMYHDSGCLDSAIIVVFITVDNYCREFFQPSIVLIVFVDVDFHLVDSILKLVSQTNII